MTTVAHFCLICHSLQHVVSAANCIGAGSVARHGPTSSVFVLGVLTRQSFDEAWPIRNDKMQQ